MTLCDFVIGSGNGVIIEAVGTGGRIRGKLEKSRRPTLLIIDDPESKESIVSATRRARAWEWFTKDVCNAGGPGSNYLLLGTNLHRECIVNRVRQSVGWVTRFFRSIIFWPERLDLWQ
jgi:hypothetical protein